MILEKTSSHYCVAVSAERLLRIIEADDQLNDSLLDRLQQIGGVYDVDYNGHFGLFVYLAIEVDYDTPTTHKAVIDVIESY